MKKIHIFLASSITEFNNERMDIENFIRKVSDKFEDRYGVKIQPLLCENFDDAYTVKRKQEEYNEQIRKSDFCYFIFFTKVGTYTREEFDVARKQFEDTKKPKIYTYFKTLGEDDHAEQSLFDFMEELDKTFGHYYGNFSHIDTLKLRILLNLKLEEMNFLEIKAENGKCVVDGADILPLSNVMEFANNSGLQKLNAELSVIEKEYLKLKPLYAKGGNDSAFYSRYSTVASKRQAIKDEIDNLQKLIFAVSLRMTEDDAKGTITERQKEAYRLFEMGDYEGCMSVLNSDDIDSDFLRERKKLKEQNEAVCRKYIKEHKTAIDILSSMTEYDERFKEIGERYEKILPVILEEGIELDTALEYGRYLLGQNSDEKALSVINTLLPHCDDNKVILSALYNLSGIINQNLNNTDKAEEFYLKSIGLREDLATKDPAKFRSELAVSYNNISIFYKDNNNSKEAIRYCLLAISIYDELSDIYPGKYAGETATIYHNSGVLFDQQGNHEDAEKYFLKAIKLKEALSKENPLKYNPSLAQSYNSAGLFYTNREKYDKAEPYVHSAIKLISEAAKTNPDKYNPDLGAIYFNTGICYANQGIMDKAESYYHNAISIYETLAQNNPAKFSSLLVRVYNAISVFYSSVGLILDSSKYVNLAIDKLKPLYEENPDKFSELLAESYGNAGNLHSSLGDFETAGKYILSGLEIFTSLADKNPDRFLPGLAKGYNNAAVFYKKQNKFSEADSYYKKAMEKFEVLSEKDPDSYLPILAMIMFNYGVFATDYKVLEKALAIAEKYPQNPRCQKIIAYLGQK